MFLKWILGIVGISALGILVDVLVKKGETEKYIKGVFGLFTLFVVVSPIPEILKMNYNFEEIFELSSTAISYDEDFVGYVYTEKYDGLERTLSEFINANYSVDADVDVYFVESCPEKIDLVYVYLKNSGIHGEEENKYIIEETRQALADRLNITKNQVKAEWQKTTS